MKDYTVIANDTFEIIARKLYGLDTESGLISRANPGVFEPLTAGISLVIPDLPDSPLTIVSQGPSVSKNEVALSIDGERFRFWQSMTLTRAIDTMDTLEFTAPFEVDNEAFKNIFVPFKFKDVSVSVGGIALFKGVMLVPIPRLEANRKSVTVSGYSLPGVLNDCNIPASAFPLEFNGQGLKDIAKTIAGHLGLSIEFEEQQGPVFERVAADPTKKALEFLSELARQRNFIISSTPQGKLLFQRSVEVGQPVARLAQGSPPLTAIAAQFKPQEFYSHITGLQPATAGIDGSQYTVVNTKLKGVIRPFTFKADDTTGADVKAAVEAKAGRMFANAVSYSASITSWRDPQGKLWRPNTTITLIAPGAMIYSEYEFVIRSIRFSKDEDSESVVLNLVLPGSFSGKIPEVLPWEL